MIVNVVPSWKGHRDRHYFMLRALSCGRIIHEVVPGDQWTRAKAREALDLLEKVYGLQRRSIRFRLH